MRRFLRVTFGLILLVLFTCFLYLKISTSPRSNDVTAAETASAPETVSSEAAEPETASETAPAVEITVASETTPEPTAEPTPEPTPEPTVDPNSPAGRAAALGLPTPPDIDVTSWEYVLVNAENSIGEYEPEDLVTIEEQRFDARIADALNAMVAAARADGLSVYLSSGYRSYSEQAANFTRVCNNNGISDGKDGDGNYITMPAGCSEHQTGLCCDITDKYYATKNSSTIAENPTFQALYDWLLEHCAEYGFILRFPDGLQSYNHVMYENWHYRYVGVEAATYIMENGLCLEQFLALYPEADGYVYYDGTSEG